MHEKLFPTYLWIGPDQDLLNKTEDFLQKVFCKNNCKVCNVCNQIKNKQHYLVRWLSPSNSYTLADIEIIFDTIKFALNKDENFFFILERADLLNISTANRLLKSLEEPPAGYHFILLSPYLDGLLPTIVSRSLVSDFSGHQENTALSLGRFFKTPADFSISELSKELEKTKFSDKDILMLIDDINLYWLGKSKNLETLEKARQKMPMPGSTKIFLKNLYLQLLSTHP